MQGKVHAEAMTAVYVGIDVSKERLDVYLHPLGERLALANDSGGWRHLGRRLSRLPAVRVVMEATSKYHRAVHRRLHAGGIPAAVVNPLRARLFAEACGQLGKTDAIDARMLALMAEQLAPDPTTPLSPSAEALQELVRARAAAVAERTAAGQRRAVATTAFLRRELARTIASLERHIARIEAEIDKIIAGDPDLARRKAVLRSIPGIGPVTAATLIADLAELGRCSDKQIAAIAGLAPHPRDSGTRQGQRRTGGGRAALRSSLYMAAVAAIRSNPDLRAFHQRLSDKGKPFKVAITAVMRKLLVLANSLIAQNRTWTQTPA
jgi:transposase